MAYAFTSTVGKRLYDGLEPWQTDSLAWYLDAVGVMFQPLADLIYPTGYDGQAAYVPSWGSVFDVDTCPAADLPYLGQFVGVSIPAGASETAARSYVRAEAGLQRGTLASLRSAVERSISTPWAPSTAYLAGVLVTNDTPAGRDFYKVTTNFTSSAGAFNTTNLTLVDPTLFYQMRERVRGDLTADPYALTVVVRPEQLTPVSDTTALLAAITANKPAGIVLYLTVTDSPRWSDATKAWSAVGGTITWTTVNTGDV